MNRSVLELDLLAKCGKQHSFPPRESKWRTKEDSLEKFSRAQPSSQVSLILHVSGICKITDKKGEERERCTTYVSVLVEHPNDAVGEAEDVSPVEVGHVGLPLLRRSAVQEVEDVSGGERRVRKCPVDEIHH